MSFFNFFFIIFTIGLIPSLLQADTFTESHYVTQVGAGNRSGISLSNAWSINDFHDSKNWNYSKAVDRKIGPGDVVYFSGTFTERVTLNQGGSAAGSVTLDGYEAGNCDPLNAVCSGSALLHRGMELVNMTTSIEYVTIQDFRMTDPAHFRATLLVKGSAPNYTAPVNRVIIRRNYIYESGERFLTFFYGKYNIIVDNKFYVFGLVNDPSNGIIVQGAVSLVEFSNSIFSRNEVGHDGSPIKSGPGGSPELVHSHGCQNLLMEYNNLYGTPGQSGLRPKEWSGGRPPNYNHVIRFNKIHNNPNTVMGKGLYLNTRPNEPISDFYIYGNYIYNNGLMGLAIGEGVSNVYAWSNILSENGRHGIVAYDTTATSKNYYFYNNTIARNNRLNESDIARGGIVITAGSNFHIKNNIFWNNRPAGERNRIQLVSWVPLFSLENNVYFHSLGDPYFYYMGEYRTLATMQTTYGHEEKSPAGVIRDPLLDSAYRLASNSPERNAGATITGSFSVNISGGDTWFEAQTGYSTINFGYEDALCPINTDWTSNPPIVATAKQNEYGNGWSRGAYVFKSYPNEQNPLPIPQNLKIIPAQ